MASDQIATIGLCLQPSASEVQISAMNSSPISDRFQPADWLDFASVLDNPS